MLGNTTELTCPRPTRCPTTQPAEEPPPTTWCSTLIGRTRLGYPLCLHPGPTQERTADQGTPTQHPLFPRAHKHSSAQDKRALPQAQCGGPAFVQKAQFNVTLTDVRVRVQASRVQGKHDRPRPRHCNGEKRGGAMQPTGPLWTREGRGISILTGEWPSSCRGPMPTRVTRGRSWETAWNSRPGDVLGPRCPSNFRAAFASCPPSRTRSCPRPSHPLCRRWPRRTRPSDRWGPTADPRESSHILRPQCARHTRTRGCVPTSATSLGPKRLQQGL